MDFLNKTFAQLTDLFRSMSSGARITSGLLLAVVVVSLGYLFTHQVSGPDLDLMNGMPVAPTELPNMEAAFAKAGLNNYEVRGTQILVPRGKKATYMAALADGQALPADIHQVFDNALKDTTAFMPRQQREEMLKIAKQKVLAMTITSMQGIERAYVLYDSVIKGGFRRETITTATASAKADGSRPLDQSQVRNIRYLVAGAIAGLKPSDVTVADLNGPIHYGSAENGGSASDNTFVALTRVHEQMLKEKILNALAYVPGVTVTPSVVLDRERINRSRTIKYDPKPVIVKDITDTSTMSREGSGPAGPPGIEINQANAPKQLLGMRSKGSTEKETTDKRDMIQVPNTEQTEVEKMGLTPQRVAVAIGIPSSYFEKIWKERNPPEDGQEPAVPDQKALVTIRDEETTKIKEYVATLLPPAKDVADLTELVSIVTFQDITPEEVPGPGLGENAMAWFGQYWGTLGMIGLAVFSLVMLRSMIQAVPAGTDARGAPRAAAAAGEEEDDSPEEAALNRLGRFTGSGRSLRDELSELIQEDTDSAANILRTWIGNVG